MNDKVMESDEAKHEEPNKAYDSLAKTLKEKFANPDWNGPFLGTVVSAPPDLKVQIDEKIILNKDKIIVDWEKVKGFLLTGNLKEHMKQMVAMNGLMNLKKGTKLY